MKSMKRILVTALFCCLVFAPVRATLIWSDSFTNANGCIETNSSGLWIAHSPTTPLKDALVNNHRLEVSTSGTGLARQDDIHRNFTVTAADPITNGPKVLHASFIVNFTNLPTPNGAYFAHFYSNSSQFF